MYQQRCLVAIELYNYLNKYTYTPSFYYFLFIKRDIFNVPLL